MYSICAVNYHIVFLESSGIFVYIEYYFHKHVTSKTKQQSFN